MPSDGTGDIVGVGISNIVTLTGTKIQDRTGDDLGSADLAAIGFVLAATELAFDADVRAFLERCRMLAQLPHAWMRCLSVRSWRSPSFMNEVLVASERVVTAFPTRGCFHFSMVAKEANEFNAIVQFFSPFVPICLGRPKARGRHSPAEGTVAQEAEGS